MIFNDFLGVNIYIVENESNKKTINTASMNWQSTYALQHLEEVVHKACGDENLPIYEEVKKPTVSSKYPITGTTYGIGFFRLQKYNKLSTPARSA